MNCKALNQADEGSTAVVLRGLGFAGCEKSGRAMEINIGGKAKILAGAE